jgi:hypothetical protein
LDQFQGARPQAVFAKRRAVQVAQAPSSTIIVAAARTETMTIDVMIHALGPRFRVKMRFFWRRKACSPDWH